MVVVDIIHRADTFLLVDKAKQAEPSIISKWTSFLRYQYVPTRLWQQRRVPIYRYSSSSLAATYSFAKKRVPEPVQPISLQ